jgi:hypothetical protein
VWPHTQHLRAQQDDAGAQYASASQQPRAGTDSADVDSTDSTAATNERQQQQTAHALKAGPQPALRLPAELWQLIAKDFGLLVCCIAGNTK